jgi:hypothetical protein
MMCRFGRREKSWSEGRVAATKAVVGSFAFDLTKGSQEVFWDRIKVICSGELSKRASQMPH